MTDRGAGGDRPSHATLVFTDRAELAAGVAERVAEELRRATDARGAASLVLSGGSTPEASYRQLTEQAVDWSRVMIFWGDERCVPPAHPASNYRMASAALLEPSGVPPGRAQRIEGELGARLAAERYQNLLMGRYGAETPEFDVVLLGVGVDGHVASLFPGGSSPGGDGRWVVPVARRPPQVDRVSLTLAVLAKARCLLILAVGLEKAGIVARARAADETSLPVVQLVRRAHDLTWMLDRAAAGRQT